MARPYVATSRPAALRSGNAFYWGQACKVAAHNKAGHGCKRYAKSRDCWGCKYDGRQDADRAKLARDRKAQRAKRKAASLTPWAKILRIAIQHNVDYTTDKA